MRRVLIIIFVLFFLFSLSWISPAFSVNVDFQVLYHAIDGVLHGIPLYDHAAQIQWVADQAGVSADKVFVLPFPYPPWYAVSTIFLALFPIEVAARLWLFLSLMMLVLSVWLLSADWSVMRRIFAFFLSFLFLPVFGSLTVGQYVFPTLLGMALLIYALKNKNVIFTAIGMALLTFKPHIGILILLFILVYLLWLRNDFGRHAFMATVYAGIFLLLTGFIADLRWPVTYLQSLLEFKGEVSECLICVSFPITLAKLIGYGFEHTLIIAAFIFFVSAFLFALTKRQLPFDQIDVNIWFAQLICIVMLVVPYLENYDFSFLLIPWLVMIAGAKSKLDWLLAALAFLIPWISLILFKREGNNSLVLTTLILFVVLLTPRYTTHTMHPIK